MLLAAMATIVVLMAVAVAIAAGVLAGGSAGAAGSASGGVVIDALTSDGPGSDIVVEVAGAVAVPGVYHLPEGSRVGDAIRSAGGYGPRVDAARATGALNLAALLEDGAQVVVPSRDDASLGADGSGSVRGGEPTGGASDEGGLVDLNGATQAELEALPGIGPVTARKIIAARDAEPFTAVDDLRTRKLVGQKAFETLRALVSVR